MFNCSTTSSITASYVMSSMPSSAPLSNSISCSVSVHFLIATAPSDLSPVLILGKFNISLFPGRKNDKITYFESFGQLFFIFCHVVRLNYLNFVTTLAIHKIKHLSSSMNHGDTIKTIC